MPWALQLPRSPAAPGLHCSGLRRRRHACFSTAAPDSLSLEVGGRRRPPPTRRPTTGFKATSSCPKTSAPSTLDPRRTNEYAPRNISFLGATGDRRDGSRLTAPPHPHITTQYCCSSPRLQQSTVQRRGAEAKAGGERATSFLGALQLPRSPAPPRLVVGETTPILSRLDSTSFPSVPVPIEFPPSLRPSSHRPTRISRLVAKIPGWSLPRFTTAPLLPLARLISSLSGAWLAGMVAGAGRVRQKRWGWPAACGR